MEEIILAFSLLILIVLIVFFSFIYGAPYQPSNRKEISRILKLAGNLKEKRVVELGSGDGRVVVELARKGAEVVGYEVNPWLVLVSRRRIRKAGINARIYWKSFWRADLGDFDVIVLYQVFSVMGRLRRKLEKEFKGKIVSNTWRFHGWKPIAREGNVYLYTR